METTFHPDPAPKSSFSVFWGGFKQKDGRKRKVVEEEEDKKPEAVWIARKKIRDQLLLRQGEEKSLLSADDIDVKCLITTTKLIIGMIRETWEQCAPYRVANHKAYNNSMNNENLVASKVEENPQCLYFQRYTLTKIKVESTNESMVFKTSSPQMDIREFSILEIPEKLTSIITSKIKPCEEGALPDYNLFMEKLFLLHDDLMVPSLLELKEHLNNLHNCLQGIESWINESKIHASFIHKCFGRSFEDIHGENSEKLKDILNKLDATSEVPAMVLKNCSTAKCGEHNQLFDISTYVGRERLVKFLDFVSI